MPDYVFDVSLPPSVNRTRRVHWRGHRDHVAWRNAAGWHLKTNGQFKAAPQRLKRYELTIVLDREHCQIDPDNVLKAGIDLLRHLDLIEDDGPQHCERIVVMWGQAPAGCRFVLKPA